MSLNTSSKKDFSENEGPPLTVNRIKEVDIKIAVN